MVGRLIGRLRSSRSMPTSLIGCTSLEEAKRLPGQESFPQTLGCTQDGATRDL